MKHLIFIAVLLLPCIVTKAQTEQGTILPGGGVTFQTSEGGSIFSFSPSIGFL
jgi:hypothetical protein